MLPGSSPERVDREAARGKQSGRTQEIQRLIGRSLRAVTDLSLMPDVQITVDCDVLQADGGTRTASISGGWIALHDACSRLVASGQLSKHPVLQPCAAISVGVIDGTPMLDLEYAEDVRAEVDMNVVMTGDGRFVELQGTAEGLAFTRPDLDALLGLAEDGIAEIIVAQREMVAEPPLPRVAVLKLPVVVATQNADKAREITEIFVARLGEPLVAYSLDGIAFVLDRADQIGASVAALTVPAEAPDVEETGETLEENARIKARALADALGVPAIADDTGLEVDALGGRPGVHSARYAGEHASYAENVAKLTAELAGVAPADRTARFATVALARTPDGREVIARGEVEGAIVEQARGDRGFGYDPVFVPLEGDGRTFAEMTVAEKHAVSHRGRAFRALADALEKGI